MSTWEGQEGEKPKAPVEPESKVYNLQDKKISFRYQGYPIRIILGDSGGAALKVGKPDDLQIEGKFDPDDFVIVQIQERPTGNHRGLLVLKDGTTKFIGDSTPNGEFYFRGGVSRMHVGIMRKRDIITIGDLNRKISGLGTTVITSNLPVPNPGSPASGFKR